MDLALGNLQGWYAIKPKPPANQLKMKQYYSFFSHSKWTTLY